MDALNGKYSIYEDETRRGPRSSRVLDARTCRERGLYCGPDYQVDMTTFIAVHPVELPDGRRFRTEACALWGLNNAAEAVVRAFWKGQSCQPN